MTLTPEEVDQLRSLLDSVMAGSRIQASMSHESRDEYQALVALRRGLLGS